VLERLWTLETAPFWHGNGFHTPTAEVLHKLPPIFGEPTAAWTVLSLRAETTAPQVDIEKEFNIFKETERARTEVAFQQGRRLKLIATITGSLVVSRGGRWHDLSYLKSQNPPR